MPPKSNKVKAVTQQAVEIQSVLKEKIKTTVNQSNEQSFDALDERSTELEAHVAKNRFAKTNHNSEVAPGGCCACFFNIFKKKVNQEDYQNLADQSFGAGF